MTNRSIKVGVIGVGFGTTVQIPGFQSEGVDVIAVCASRQERADRAAKEFGIRHAYDDYHILLRNPDIDAVSVVSPPFLHYEMSMAALEAGKHILCEKPFALDQKQAQEMSDKATESGLTAMITYEFRFAPARAYVKELLAQGYIGQLRNINMSLFTGPTATPQPRPMTWQAMSSQGGGFLGALGSHYIDCLRDWFGEIDSVVGATFTQDLARVDQQTGQSVTGDADDAFQFTVNFQNGGWGSMTASSSAPYGGGTKIEIYGSEGTLQAPQPGFNPPPDGKIFGARFSDGAEVEELLIPDSFKPFNDVRDNRLLPFRLLARRFIQGIAEGTSLSPNFYDGLRCQQVLDAVRESSATGTRIQLPNL